MLNEMLEGKKQSDLVKLATMTPLQQQAAELGFCPRCHAKTLAEKHEGAGMSFMQCGKCLHVYVLPSNIT